MKGIEVHSPVDIEFTDEEYRQLDGILQAACDRYCDEHPDRVCWVFGQGDKCIYMPMTKAEEDAGRTAEYDDTVFSIEIAEREAYPKEIERNRKRIARLEQRERAELSRLKAKYESSPSQP